MEIKGRFLVDSGILAKEFKYEIIEDIYNYNGGKCIVVKYLNPDLVMLLPEVDLIVSERGSALSHISIIAMEQGKNVVLVDEDIIDRIKKKGMIAIEKTMENGNNIVKVIIS